MARLTATFGTRRDAEMVVEQLVQEHHVDRRSVQVAPEGPANSAGDETAGSDTASGEPTPPARADSALDGRIAVTVDVADDEADKVRATFDEFARSEGAEA